jgi:hypothetical protein
MNFSQRLSSTSHPHYPSSNPSPHYLFLVVFHVHTYAQLHRRPRHTAPAPVPVRPALRPPPVPPCRHPLSATVRWVASPAPSPTLMLPAPPTKDLPPGLPRPLQLHRGPSTISLSTSPPSVNALSPPSPTYDAPVPVPAQPASTTAQPASTNAQPVTLPPPDLTTPPLTSIGPGCCSGPSYYGRR